MWCVPKIDEEFVQRMENVLRLYARKPKDDEPVVCLDERPVQLRGSKRVGRPIAPGRAAQRDYEYVRRGTANIFCIIEPLTGRRLTHATRSRTGREFAQALKKIARRYRHARKIHLVMDNLSSHSEKCCIAAYGEVEGRRLWRRFEVHFTPKHASWLNAAELEASLVARECLGRRRIDRLELLQSEVRAWNQRADKERRGICWSFRVKDARSVFRYDGIVTQRSQH